MFVPGRYMAPPRVRTYIVPLYRRTVLLRATRVVNRTRPVQGARLAVNPGISPSFVARVSGAPIATYRVRPRVFAATQGVTGAVQVRREELGGPGVPRGPVGAGARPGIGPATARCNLGPAHQHGVQPSAAATAPQPLGKNEPGQLGAHPPRAAQGAAPPISTPRPASPQQTGAAHRHEHREREPKGAPLQPNIVRPIPPQELHPRLRQVQPPPQPAPLPQRQVQPVPPSSAPPPQQRQVRSPAVAHAPPPAAARAPAPPPPKKPPPKPGEKQEEKKYRNAIQLSRKNDTGRHEGGPLVLKLLPDQCISTFLNCQGSRLSMSSGKRPGRPVRGVQSV